MTTDSEARLARIAYVLFNGAKNAGIPLSEPTRQRLTMSMSKVMDDEGIYLEYKSRIGEKLKEMENG